MHYLIKFILLSLLLSLPGYGQPSLNIVVSIKPIHSLAAFICQGVTEPILLMTGNSSPHTQSLTPQQLQVLKQADLVIWIGENYEAPWSGVIKTQAPTEKVLTLINSKNLTLYPYRQQCFTVSCHESHDHHDHGGSPHKDLIDGHIWLDISNACIIAKTIAMKLIEIDPTNKEKYKANLDQLLKNLIALENDLKGQLKIISKKNYIIYHDGLQYFDKFFGFQMAASLVIEPDIPSNAQDYLILKGWLDKTVDPQKPCCIFTEPFFQENYSQNLATEFGLKIQSLDYLGLNFSEGPNLYFSMMRQLITDFITGMS